MAYQTIDPYTDKLVQTFTEHTDTELEEILAKAEKTYETRLESEISSRA